MARYIDADKLLDDFYQDSELITGEEENNE